MEYRKIVNLLDNASNQPSKFRTRNWVEINDDSRGTYTNADAYIFVKGTKTITGAENDDAARQADERDKV